MRCAIVGAGLSGLTLAYHLEKQGIEVTLFEPRTKYSGFQAGVMHPYPGKKCLLTKLAAEGMHAAIQLLNAVEAYRGEAVTLREGILRTFWEGEPGFADVEKVDEGYLIASGITIFMEPFMHSLKSLLKAKFEERNVANLDELSEFDHVILACGRSIANFDDSLPIQFIKGQVFTGRHKDVTFSRSVIGPCHVTKMQGGMWQVGATYEHHTNDPAVDPDIALGILKKKMDGFIPPFEEWEDVTFHACFRVSQKGKYLPLIKKVDNRVTIFTALGSRGFIYASYFAEKIAKDLCANSEKDVNSIS